MSSSLSCTQGAHFCPEFNEPSTLAIIVVCLYPRNHQKNKVPKHLPNLQFQGMFVLGISIISTKPNQKFSIELLYPFKTQ